MVKTSRKQFNTLRDWREACGLNGTEAAKILGISKACYSRYERFAAPKRVTAKKLADRTGVPLAQILRIA